MKYYHFGRNPHVQIASTFNPDPLEAIREGDGPFLIILDSEGPTVSGNAIEVIDEYLMSLARFLRPLWSQPESVQRALNDDPDLRSMGAAQSGEAFAHYSSGRTVPDLPHPTGVAYPVSASAALVTQLVLQGQWKAATNDGGVGLHIVSNIVGTAAVAGTAQVPEREEAHAEVKNAFRMMLVSMLDAWSVGKHE